MNKNPHTIELKQRQLEYLERMVKKHGLPDVSKAVRILVDFALHEADEEERIFTKMRCSGC
ncbi:MAG: hypothetical protein ACYTGP_12165 [Planctomycetota bacterium]|jgi:metal-responsive CopG/Arc/MetJ family transcriptional regulator